MDINGKIKKIEKRNTTTKDMDTDTVIIHVKNDLGDKVTIEGLPGISDGLSPEDDVIITFKKSQRTLNESL